MARIATMNKHHKCEPTFETANLAQTEKAAPVKPGSETREMTIDLSARDKASAYWHQDCLSLVLILSGCLSGKDLARLGRKAGLWSDQPPVEVRDQLLALHQACHLDAGLRRTIAKQINGRFPALIRKVRSADLAGIQALDRETDWPVYLVWACLTDHREDVRDYGRRLTHELVRSAVREVYVEDFDYADPEELTELKKREQTLVLENKRLADKLSKSRADSRRLKKTQRQDNGLPAAPSQPMTNLSQQREIRKLRYELDKARTRLKELQEAAEQDCPYRADHQAGTAEADWPQRAERCCRGKSDCATCPLEGRRVAVIGGLTRLMPAYREMVNNLGADVEFHAGCVKNGGQALSGLCRRCDLVVFITSVNSHVALKVAKQACKKCNNRFIAVRQTGVATLEKTLRQVTAG